MPVELQHIVRDERTITIQVSNQEAQVTYRPGAMTPILEMALAESRYAPEAVAEIVSELVIDWEVFQNGERVPTDMDTLMKLPSELVAETFRAISEDLSNRREERKNSEDGSPQTASKGNRRGGSTFSRPRKS